MIVRRGSLCGGVFGAKRRTGRRLPRRRFVVTVYGRCQGKQFAVHAHRSENRPARVESANRAVSRALAHLVATVDADGAWPSIKCGDRNLDGDVNANVVARIDALARYLHESG